MFYLKTKDKYRKKVYLIDLFFKIFLSMFFVVFIFNIIFILNIVSIDEKIFKNVIQYTFYLISSISVILLIIRELIFIKYKNLLIKEYLEILSKVTLPIKQPKVLYVYTTNNDFLPSRLLQNMQQTYQNIEYWISDGSSDLSISKQIAEFAAKHNINLFKMNRPSINKADNLNTFLEQTNVKFDYLLIGDADVVFDRNLVKCNIKYFYSENQIQLGYVSSLVQNYKTKNFFSNMLRFVENIGMFKIDIYKVLRKNHSLNLYSACCLLKKDFLDDMNNFPKTCFEDGYLELDGSKRYWYGLISPLTLCVQKFDKNVKKLFDRWLRIMDWMIKYSKDNGFKNINNKYISSYNKYFSTLFIGPAIIFGIIILPVIIFCLVIFWSIITNQYFYFICLAIWIIGFFLLSMIKNNDTNKIIGKSASIFFPLFQFLLYIAYWPKVVKHWFLAFVLGKYSEFKPSWDKNIKTSYSFKDIKFEFLMTILNFILLVISISLFVLYKWYEINYGFLFLFIFLVSIFFILFISYLSYLILYSLSYIETNKKYNDDNFIDYDNDYVKFIKIKNDFFEKNPEIDRFC